MGKHDKPQAARPPQGPFNNPFAALKGKLGLLPEGSAAPPPAAPRKAVPERAVIRFERKGHGGKEATRVEKLGLPAGELEEWLRALKQSWAAAAPWMVTPWCFRATSASVSSRCSGRAA